MSTPTDQQQIRATLRRHAKAHGDDEAARLAIVHAADIVGMDCVMDAVRYRASIENMANPGWMASGDLPPLLGAAEAADLLGMKATNLKRLSPPLPVAAVVSGRIPIYRLSDVQEAKARRDARRAAA